MKPASRNRKGTEFQNRIARMLAFVTGLTEEDFIGCKGGKKERDILLSRAARSRWPIHTECKNHKTLAMPSWIRQAQEDTALEGLDLAPAVVFKIHGSSEPYVTMSLIDFFGMVFGPLTESQISTLRKLSQGKKP